jgi:hypothetical protein
MLWSKFSAIFADGFFVKNHSYDQIFAKKQ